ncbi:chaperone protein DnaJ-like [Salvia hispanica]|uniref:chaperone protein DnaJ-like n=1 Tax=Salvia hispanica TaxID=49212 RepID=UPI00200902C9|nr:chaperone protein DnaJ-like [Salvia hispanica]
MAGEEDKSCDYYAVLELKKECTSAELRHAYKKLALKWHPDRFSASGNSKYLDEAKKKFQAIQQAYSVLSDTNKRFLYDVGVYDCNDDDDNDGMGEFLNEMATMMNQTKSSEGGNETLEELQELFDDLFESDIKAFVSSSRSDKPPTRSSSSSSASGNEAYGVSNKRSSNEMRPGTVGESSRKKNAKIGRR